MGFVSVAHAAEEGGLSIHLAPQVLGHVFGIPLTNTLVTVWFVMIVLAVLVFFIRKNLTEVPGKLQLVIESLIGYVHDFVEETLENKVLAKKVFPLVLTIFIFVLAANWIGLLPGVDSIGITTEQHGESSFIGFLHPANTDLNITLALALISFFAIEVIGISLLGAFTYARKFLNFGSPMKLMVGIIELFSEFARLISFAFRLFGNIFAGKTLILVAIFFVPYVVPVPLLAFELFVGFIQAFIFAILTLFFIKLAVEMPH
ncbi:F0F1 ATP synthase subunit A [Candidatus Kaiserbacteria bacterium]|nr:F0F1 ATP synthase subunit A [Candidatus Kaiserbacteria bacterium]